MKVGLINANIEPMPSPKEVSINQKSAEKAQKLLDPEKGLNKPESIYENDNFKSIIEKSNLKVIK